MKFGSDWRGVISSLGIAACLVLAVILLPTSSAHAADTGFNLTTSPLPIELLTSPGQTVSSNLRVQNSGTAPVKIKVSLLKFKASGSNGQPELLPRQPGDVFFDWVSFSRTSFVANPGVWETITMTVNPPLDAAFGYYYAVVFGQDITGTIDDQPVTTSKLAGAAATLVLLDVKTPNEKKQIAVASFSTDRKLYEYLPTNFNITVRNTGNIHLVPKGNIYISRSHKKNIAVIDVNPNLGNTLPQSSRVFSVSWNDGFPVYQKKTDNGQVISDKSGKPVLQLNYDFSKTNKLRFGKYYAHLTLIYDDGAKDVPIEARYCPS